MTIRQLWVRMQVFLNDPASPLVKALLAAREEAEETEQITGMDAALDLVRKR